MVYGNFKNLPIRTASDKLLCPKPFNIAKNPKYDGYKRGLPSMVYKVLDKKSTSLADKSASVNGIKTEIKQNEKLAEELHKPIIRKFEKVHSSFKDNIWGAYLGDMQLINKFNKEIRFLLCVIVIFSKYASVILLKDKKNIRNTNDFQKILDESKHKPNKT